MVLTVGPEDNLELDRDREQNDNDEDGELAG